MVIFSSFGADYYIRDHLHRCRGFSSMLTLVATLLAGCIFVSITYAIPKYSFLPLTFYMLLVSAGAYLNSGPKTALNLMMCTVLLIAAIVFRLLDMPLCNRFRFGLYAVWHILSAISIWWLKRIHSKH